MSAPQAGPSWPPVALPETLPDFVILVTGSRVWPPGRAETIHQAIFSELVSDYHENPADPLLIHGGATGVDTLAGAFWSSLDDTRAPEVYRLAPEDWRRMGTRAGPIRNSVMVHRTVDYVAAGVPAVVLAFPWGRSIGTRGCIELARAAGLHVFTYEGTDLIGSPPPKRPVRR